MMMTLMIAKGVTSDTANNCEAYRQLPRLHGHSIAASRTRTYGTEPPLEALNSIDKIKYALKEISEDEHILRNEY